MSKAIVTAFHRYQPYGAEYYDLLLDFFLLNQSQWKDEFDTLYILDSTWGITGNLPPNVKVIKVNPNLRYYDAYKWILPQLSEDYILFMDNDMVIWKRGIVKKIFSLLHKYDVVSIYDTIGEYHPPILGGKSKFCPYLFASKRTTFEKYLGYEWGPVPWGETLSEVTKHMLEDGLIPFEMQEDKSSIYFDGTKDGEGSHKLGYYHIRSGSVGPLLLSYRKYDYPKYEEYIKNQPKREYVRQLMWYAIMGMMVNPSTSIGEDLNILFHDLGMIGSDIEKYMMEFIQYHGIHYEKDSS